jgi:hypothetical protein
LSESPTADLFLGSNSVLLPIRIEVTVTIHISNEQNAYKFMFYNGLKMQELQHTGNMGSDKVHFTVVLKGKNLSFPICVWGGGK